jgi:rSAM/selenodomain-associated transferase 1
LADERAPPLACGGPLRAAILPGVLDKLIIFVKAPRPGQVKTRLAEAIGPVAACEAYKQLVRKVLDQVKELATVELRFAPDDAADEIAEWLQPGWKALAQGNGDLGERLNRAFDHAFATGSERVVAIGSDCPAVTQADIHLAWNSLRKNDVVLGPACDGGYWLIGLKAPTAGIFENIAWSTSTVLEQTREHLKRTGRSYHLLRELTDVDTEIEWNAFLGQAQ